MPEFKTIGLDAVVGSVGNGSTLRLISDIPGVKYTEGRLLPYFFPDTFHEGGDPVKEARENWVTARRAILRKRLTASATAAISNWLASSRSSSIMCRACAMSSASCMKISAVRRRIA